MIGAERKGGTLKLRIAIWTVAGAIAVLSWSLCFMAMQANHLGALWALVYLTIPITSVARSYPHPIGMYSVLVVNMATYALVGTVVEILRRHYRLLHLISK
jgi:hypothetical protein